MECPQCGSECYDNRQKVEGGWKGPIYKCKDQDCSWKQWPPKGPKNGGSGPKTPRVTYTWDELGKVYLRCKQIAAKVWGESLPAEALVAAVAAVFIAAKDQGLKVEAPKPQPTEEPPY